MAMEPENGKCAFCGADNSFQRVECGECGTRLPWADEVENARVGSAQTDVADSPDVPVIKISTPAQWLPPQPPLNEPRANPNRLQPRIITFQGGNVSRHCCCGCLFLVMLFTLLPMSCVMTGGTLRTGPFNSNTRIHQPVRPRWNR